MIRKFHKWVADTFLPGYCYAALREDLAAAEEEMRKAKEIICRQDEVIDNLRYALRYSGKVSIKIEGAAKNDATD